MIATQRWWSGTENVLQNVQNFNVQKFKEVNLTSSTQPSDHRFITRFINFDHGKVLLSKTKTKTETETENVICQKNGCFRLKTTFLSYELS